MGNRHMKRCSLGTLLVVQWLRQTWVQCWGTNIPHAILLLLSSFSHVRLCDPIDGSPPGSSAPGILQARTLEWVAIAFSNACMHAKSLQSYLTLCDPMDSSPPGSSVHRILQAKILEWVAISFSLRGQNFRLLNSLTGGFSTDPRVIVSIGMKAVIIALLNEVEKT